MLDAADPHPNPQETLTAKIRAGDRAAFEALFRAQYAPLCGFAHRYLRDRHAAEDLVQTLFADLWADRSHLAIQTNVRAYLFAAVRNRALNIRKHELVERDWARDEALPEVRALHSRPRQPDAALEQQAMEASVADAMESLPERCRMVMRLRWQEQMRYAEIAQVMGISVKGVENQLARGLRALRVRLTGSAGD